MAEFPVVLQEDVVVGRAPVTLIDPRTQNRAFYIALQEIAESTEINSPNRILVRTYCLPVVAHFSTGADAVLAACDRECIRGRCRWSADLCIDICRRGSESYASGRCDPY